MQVATQQLRNTSMSLAQVAEIVGNDSEAGSARMSEFATKRTRWAAPVNVSL
jgi:hypothetical protein